MKKCKEFCFILSIDFSTLLGRGEQKKAQVLTPEPLPIIHRSDCFKNRGQCNYCSPVFQVLSQHNGGSLREQKIIHFKIINWKKYQKEDARVFYRTETSHIHDSKIQLLSSCQYRLWHTLLAIAAAQHKEGSASILASTLRSLAQIKGVSTHTQLCKLSELGLIELQKERKKEREERDKKGKRQASPDPSPSAEKIGKTKPEEIFNLWLEKCGDIHRPKKLTEKWRRALSSRLKEYPDFQFWLDFANAVKTNRFCNGDNERGWKADFSWFITETATNNFCNGVGLWKSAQSENKKPTQTVEINVEDFA